MALFEKQGLRTSVSRRAILARAGSLLAAGACGALVHTPAFAKTTKINVALTFLATGRFGAFYLAKKRGYYRDAGLDVTITAAGGAALGFQMLSTGTAQFCVGDIAQMLQLQSKNPKPKMRSMAVVYSKEPMACYYREGHGIAKPKDLENKTIADGPGSVGNSLFPIFAHANSIDASKVKWKFASPSAKTGLFLQGDVDAVMTYLLSLPSIEKGLKPGDKLGYFLYGDHGVEVYGDGILTTDAFLKSDAQAAKAFTRASLRAMKDMFDDPQAAVDAMTQDVLTLNPTIALREISLVKQLALGPEQLQHGLGYHSAQKMQSSWLAVVDVLKQPIARPYSDFYTNEAI